MESQEAVPKRSNNGQLNLNTWLLAICVGLSSWVLYNINQLDSEIASMIQQINADASAIQSINQVNKEQTEKMDDALTRIKVLETLQSKK
jgi:alpha-N-acetylglucosamine transferase